MTLENKLNEDLKTALKSKDKASLRSIRAIKTALGLVKTDGSGNEINEEIEIKILQKLVKQRQDSLDIYIKQDRKDLAKVEMEEIEVIQKYLPKQLQQEELTGIIREIITKSNASSMKDMGKVMGIASKQLAGKADGKSISAVVKKLLSLN